MILIISPTDYYMILQFQGMKTPDTDPHKGGGRLPNGSLRRSYYQLEIFDKDSKAKEKGRISVKFQDKDTNFSQNSEQPCQVHQN